MTDNQMTDNQMKALISLICASVAGGLVTVILKTSAGILCGIKIGLTIILLIIVILGIDRTFETIKKQRIVLKDYDELTSDQKKDVIQLLGKDAEKILKTTKQKIIIKNGHVLDVTKVEKGRI